MKLQKRLGLAAVLFMTASSAFALDPIIRPYQSVRSAGMGGVRMTTGLYDENFFNNPARATANPRSKFTILQMTPVELNPDAISAASSVISGVNPLTVAANNVGKNLHSRFQLILPAYYLAAVEERKTAVAIGMIASVQMDASLRQAYQMNLAGIADIGLAATVARKFMEDDKLSVGVTTHLIYRAASNPNYSLVDYVSGTLPSINSIAVDGAMIDFDLGGTYNLLTLGEFDIAVAMAFQNILGGSYKNIPLSILNNGGKPTPQWFSAAFGGSISRKSWWIFTDTALALEFTDFFNNANGSFFRNIHIGGETHWHSLAIRLGLNQGYLAAGIGFDFGFFTLDAATYGEEMGLNTGVYQDRRYTLNFGFHI